MWSEPRRRGGADVLVGHREVVWRLRENGWFGILPLRS
jgi:hypothetical protein